MRTKLYYILLATVYLLMGCREEYTPNEVSRDVSVGKVKFVLPRNGASVTYPTRATEVGEATEYNISSLAIYQFDVHTGVYEDAFLISTAGNNDDRVSGAEHVLTNALTGERALTIDLGPTLKGVKHFYMVANLGNKATADQIGTLALNVRTTTAAQFEAALLNPDNGYIAKESDLPMYSVVGNAPYIEVDPDNIITAGYPLKLRRSVARIDILNYSHDWNGNTAHDDELVTNFEVLNVVVTAANAKGKVFPVSALYDGAAAERLDFTIDNTGDVIDSINRPTIKYGTDSVASIVPKAVFYMLPTRMNDAVSQIWIHGDFAGHGMVLPVTLPKGATNDTIAPNYIYRIQIQKIAAKDFVAELTVADYEQADTLNVAPKQGMTVSPFYDVTGGKSPSKDTKVDSLAYVNTQASTTEPTQIRFTVSSKSATEKPYITGLLKDWDLKTGTPTFVVSPTPHYETEYTLQMPYKNSLPVVNDTVMIRSMEAGKDTLAMFVVKAYVPQYLQTGAYPVSIGGIWWAPVNVGATSLPADPKPTTTTFEMVGYCYQFGRTNAPFNTFNASSFTVAAGPKSMSEANANPTVFYTGADWLATSDPMYAKLWKDENAQGPCPAGWRVPTTNECSAMIGSTTPNKENAGWYSVQKTQTDPKLYFPVANWMPPGSGACSGTNTTIWSLGNKQTGQNSNDRYWIDSNGKWGTGSTPSAAGLSVRCVADLQQ